MGRTRNARYQECRVRLGRSGDQPPAEFFFPDRKAAERYADDMNAIYPDRVVILKGPDNRIIKKYGKAK